MKKTLSYRIASYFARKSNLAIVPKSMTLNQLLQAWSNQESSDAYGAPAVENMEKYMRAYRDNVWMKASVSFMGRNLSSVPMVMKTQKNDKDEIIRDHVALDLVYSPYPKWNYQRYMFFIAAALMLNGNFYAEKIKGKSSGKTFQLKPLSSARMKPIIDENNEVLAGYEYTKLNGIKKYFKVEEILHIQLYNPENEFWGMPEMAPVRLQTETDNNYVKYNNKLLKNGSLNAPYIKFPAGQEVDADKLAKFVEFWEQEHRGVDKAGKIGWIADGGTIENAGQSQKDMEYIAGRKLLREDICAVDHIPPLLLGILDQASYSNYDTAIKIYWEEAAIPMSELICNGHDEIAMEYDPRLGIWYAQDFSRVQALRENLTPKIDQAAKLWGMGVPFNKAAELVGLEMEKIEGGDIGYLPYSLQPAGSISESPDEEETTPEPDDEPEKSLSHDHGAVKGLKTKGKGVTDIIGREKYLEYYIKRITTGEGAYKKDLDEMFNDLIDEVVENWDKQGEKGITKAAELVLFDEGAFVERKVKMSEKHYRRIAEIEGKLKADEVNSLAGTNFSFQITDPRINKFIAKQGLKNAKLVRDTAKAEVNKIIKAGQTEGLGMAEIGSRLNEKLIDFKRHETVRIAQTELASAANNAADQSLKQAEEITGLKLGEEWVSSGQDNMRDAHAEADGQVVRVGEKFNVGDEQLEYPGDPNGSPENIINCHCAIATRIMED